MKDELEYLLSNGKLDRTAARSLFLKMMGDESNVSQIAALLAVLRLRFPTVDEVCGFRDAALELALPIDLSAHNVMDVCGTGGDGKSTFNISTLSAVVVAACGVKIAKHGNNAVSSRCGSSNVLEHLGYKFSNNQSVLSKELEKVGITFLHAPLFHPSFAKVAPVRRDLGVKTVFNLLGPLVNPARPKVQVAGVYSREVFRLYKYVAQSEKLCLTVVHTLDVCDEVSLTTNCQCSWENSENTYSPGDFGFDSISYSDISEGASVEDSAKIFKEVLAGQGTAAQSNVVIANSAIALRTAYISKGKNVSLVDCVSEAKDALMSKRAEKTFSSLLEINSK